MGLRGKGEASARARGSAPRLGRRHSEAGNRSRDRTADGAARGTGNERIYVSVRARRRHVVDLARAEGTEDK